jgi:hypothetical protein
MKRELLQQALDVLDMLLTSGFNFNDKEFLQIGKVTAALEAELAKPEPRNDAAWYWHDLYKAKCEEIEFGFAITPTPKLAEPEQKLSYEEVHSRINTWKAKQQALVHPEQDHGFDRTASHMAGEYVDTKQENLNTSAERVQESDKSIHEMQWLGQVLEQEPVAWMSQGGAVSRSKKYFEEMGFNFLLPLYISPPRKEWVGLTDEEQVAIASTPNKSRHWIVCATEAKLKDKNNG